MIFQAYSFASIYTVDSTFAAIFRPLIRDDIVNTAKMYLYVYESYYYYYK